MTCASFELQTPVGILRIAGTAEAIEEITFEGEGKAKRSRAPLHGALLAARTQLREYFAGSRRTFDLPLKPHGTPFQLAVWRALREIPFGETWTYGELAAHLDRPGAARAVGAACGRNPHSIVVPCHRVIGASGSLVGFGGGIQQKRTLLRHEGALPKKGRSLQLFLPSEEVFVR